MLEIELPPTLVTDLSAQATQIVADLSPIWLLVGGIVLGFGIIAFVVGLLAHSRTVSPVQAGQGGDDMDDMDNEMP